MLKKPVISIFIAFIVLSTVVSVTIASAIDPDENDVYPLCVYDVLSELEIDFAEYVALLKPLSHTGEYQHFLSENKTRYEAFQNENPEMPRDVVLAYVNANIDLEFFRDIVEIQNPDSLYVLVNKNHILPRNWSPDDLFLIDSWRRVRKEAAFNFLMMQVEMENHDLSINTVSAYRSFGSQAMSHANASELQGLTITDSAIARPGHSEHQTGLAIDLLSRSSRGSLSGSHFQDSYEFEWLSQNAHKYGFILRYPEEYSDVHGYIFEPWHWRYIGVEIATVMFDEGISLFEEFYGRYLVLGVLENAVVAINTIRELELLAIFEAEEIARLEAEAEAEAEAQRLAEEALAKLEAEEAERLGAMEMLKSSEMGIEEQDSINTTEIVDETNLSVFTVVILPFLSLGFCAVAIKVATVIVSRK
ncbi:MAG: M15 family metallopeptidase [Oscillospiraceae bacterium]|jgi:D-alanyl-D-alanine carboxypeptidase|nr:M15 family metallopeptidase [Oscillospiraceae bacterium]